MATGFRRWLSFVRRSDELPLTVTKNNAESCGKLPEPTLRISLKGKRQVELKAFYRRLAEQRDQCYRLSIYVFYPRELEAVQTNFFAHMFQTIRLHTPETTLAELACSRTVTPDGPFHFLEGNSKAEGLSSMTAAEVTEAVDKLTQQLQLAACMLRSAIRAAAKDTAGTLHASRLCLTISYCKKLSNYRSAEEHGFRQDGSAPQAAEAAKLLVQKIKEGLLSFEQRISTLKAGTQPAALQCAALQVDEFLLFEAENTLLRLLQDAPVSSHYYPHAVYAPAANSNAPSGCSCQLPSRGSSPVKPAAQQEAALRRMLEPMEQAGPLTAQDHLTEGILFIQGRRAHQGCQQSLVNERDPQGNENYTQHIKLLKRNARCAVTLFHQNEEPTVLRPILVDVVGATIAGIAMLWQILTIFMGQKFSHVRINYNPQGIYAGPYMVMSVIGYMMKDRIKEWGKRYLQPVAQAMGLQFPDRIANITNHKGQAVGRCWEKCQVANDKAPSSEVRAQRQAMHKEQTGPTQPERVLIYRKTMEVGWEALCQEGQAIHGLDDVTRLDLGAFCRKMEPAQEAYYRLQREGNGSFKVQQVACARVYHLHIVLRASLFKGRSNRKLLSKACRATVVMDQEGIKRLES